MLVDAVFGLVKVYRVTKACGMAETAEVVAALEVAPTHMKRGQTLIADRGYDDTTFVRELRKLGIHAHPRAKTKHSALDGRTTDRPGYQANMKRRLIPEPVFGWVKGPGRMRQTMLRGTDKVDGQFHLTCMAYTLKDWLLRPEPTTKALKPLEIAE